MIQGDDKWYQVCNVILGAAVAGVTAQVTRSYITTGQIAWDECCAGQLVVSYTRTAPTESFPTEAIILSQYSDSTECVPPYEVGEITVQIVRCAPQALNGQNSPSPDVLSAHALQTLIDANQIRHSVSVALCALKANVPNRFDYFIRSQLMLGPEGACDGSELYVYAGLAVG